MRLHSPLLLALAAIAVPAALNAQSSRAARSEDFQGAYQNEKTRVELRRLKKDRFDGTIYFGGRLYTIQGRANKGALTGSFADRQNTFPFTATLEGEGKLRLSTGGAVYVLERSIPPNPLAPQPPKPIPQTGVLHRHPAGLVFRVPEQWTAYDTSGGTAVLPPGVPFDPSGSAGDELYVVASHEGFRGIDDAGLLDQLRQDLARSGLRFERAGEREPFQAGERKGSVLTWELRNPESGVPMMIRIYLVEAGGRIQSLAAIAARDRVLGWDVQLRQIAGSMEFAPAAGADDQRPAPSPGVSAWLERLSGNELSQSGSEGGVTRRKVIYLARDGSFTFSGDASAAESTADRAADPAAQVRDSGAGNWKIILRGDQPFLELTFSDGARSTLQLTSREGTVYLDGVAAEVRPPESAPPR